MTDFTISLAGVPIGVSAVEPTTEHFCADYLTDEAPVLTVSLTKADISAEREHSEKTDAAHGAAVRRFSDRYLETLALYRKVAAALLDYDTLLIHGSVIALDGGAYMFTAPSGTGKTTHTKLWLENVPGTHVLNGDKPLIKITESGIFACGTPWRGKEKLGQNETLPLKGVCVIGRAAQNRIEKVKLGDVLNDIIRQTHVPDGCLVKTLALIGRLDALNYYRLFCNTEPEAALLSSRYMAQ